MRRETDDVSGTQRIVFTVDTASPPAVVQLILGSRPYLWIGEANGGPCMGCIDQKGLRNLGNAILRELRKRKAGRHE